MFVLDYLFQRNHTIHPLDYESFKNKNFIFLIYLYIIIKYDVLKITRKLQFSSNFTSDIIELQIQWHDLFSIVQSDCLFICYLDKLLPLKCKASNLLNTTSNFPSTYLTSKLFFWSTMFWIIIISNTFKLLLGIVVFHSCSEKSQSFSELYTTLAYFTLDSGSMLPNLVDTGHV